MQWLMEGSGALINSLVRRNDKEMEVVSQALPNVAAIKYLDANPLPVDAGVFDRECGVGK
jgi:hypothetical protein